MTRLSFGGLPMSMDSQQTQGDMKSTIMWTVGALVIVAIIAVVASYT
jgi:heme/copper-type cytochrome/quinol oxidase subunit 2